ncbi:MAG: hypothetical protein KJ941_08220, partial [Bacteroidetes bacterium]|nr:hypothetical protein [Bacteroidota bacterium]
MNTINRIYWPLQIFGWLAYGSLLIMFTYMTKPEALTLIFSLKILATAIIAIALTHIMRSIILSRKWLDINLVSVLPRIIILSLTVAGLLVVGTRTFSYFMNLIGEGEDTFQISRIIVDWIANSILILFWNSIYFSYCFFRKYYFQEINNLTIES